MAFTCPRCGRASQHRDDESQGYCGACHDWTGLDVTYGCAGCGGSFPVPPSHVGAVWCPCGSPERMSPVLAPSPPVLQARVTADPSVPPGQVLMVSGAHGLSQFIGRTSEELFFTCEQPGQVSADPAAVARYMAERYGDAPPPHDLGMASLAGARLEVTAQVTEEQAALITGLLQSPPADWRDHAYPGLAEDDTPWSDPMQWSPGDAELLNSPL
jgi:hypothetical protein